MNQKFYEKKFSKTRCNPIRVIEAYWPKADISHIKYNPKMKKGEYDIIRQCSHDGILWFTVGMIQEALVLLVNMQSLYKPKNPSNWDTVKAIHYEIGMMKHSVVYGMVYLDCSRTQKYPGLRERIRMPVISTLIYK